MENLKLIDQLKKEGVFKLETKYGVLIIAHGSKSQGWEDQIKRTVDKVQCAYPIVISYLEFSVMTIERGIEELEEMGVTQIIIVPLFVSSGSSHIEEIKFALGISHAFSGRADIQPVKLQVPVIWREPMNAHPIVLDILSDQIQELSKAPEKESLLIAAHGSKQPSLSEKWSEQLEKIKSGLERRFAFEQVEYGSLYPDNLREAAEDLLSKGGKVLVIPLVLSEGYLTKKSIPAKLDGLDYIWNGKTIVPHNLVARWIEQQIGEAEAEAEGKCSDDHTIND
ncbi:cobalamin biosynthesis protein CbiX [Evansella sp. LMS18]|uniref:sirohydrochlorin chelatase n=1 Tax=Evansella sp. LMS18 TaxID=2924033 RepID=UPI0020D1733F|nr:CbiX/SirB N-terminal domain-containing protein [Evansella sp. LMS18]UTR11062.1 cobalamin biosynthesis protein CbiX [Evansella sp. LMS18]